MLSEVCAHLHNYFCTQDDIHEGEYTISEGTVTLPFLSEGQYFRVCGSRANDGVWKYPCTGLTDETFCGTVWAMRVPPDMVELCEEIAEWNESFGAAQNPYSSETFGSYSYTRASGSNGRALTWKDAFFDRLNRFRKVQ